MFDCDLVPDEFLQLKVLWGRFWGCLQTYLLYYLLDIMAYGLGWDSHWCGFLRLSVQLWEVQVSLLLKEGQ